MKPRPPQPDGAVEPEWHRDVWKFSMGMDELFTTLHSRFNKWSAPLQSFEAFHHNVWEISSVASTREELSRALFSGSDNKANDLKGNGYEYGRPCLVEGLLAPDTGDVLINVILPGS
ncbi:hypothetical protein F4803DRAFT_570747 [Xylaria telfairii]|nr:hypothetical protein F4803DRAFT_570747 [Xylaria telfairii]